MSARDAAAAQRERAKRLREEIDRLKRGDGEPAPKSPRELTEPRRTKERPKK